MNFCFAEFDTSVICHAVFRLCLGSFLLQDMLSKVSIDFGGIKLEIFRDHVSKVRLATENHKPAIMLPVSVGGL